MEDVARHGAEGVEQGATASPLPSGEEIDHVFEHKEARASGANVGHDVLSDLVMPKVVRVLPRPRRPGIAYRWQGKPAT